jgi:hypothetical protein
MEANFDFVCQYTQSIATPIALSLSFAAETTLFGGILYYVRKNTPSASSSDTFSVSLLSVVSAFPVFGLTFVSQVFFCYVCFDDKNTQRFGVAWLLIKLICAGWVFVSTYRFWTVRQTTMAKAVMSWIHFSRFRSLYTMLAVFVLLQPPLFRFFPWSNSLPMPQWTGGFPSYSTFFQCTLLHILQSILVLALQVEYALSVTNFDQLSLANKITFFGSLSTTLLTTVITIFEIVMVKMAISDIQLQDRSLELLDLEQLTNISGISNTVARSVANTQNTRSVSIINPIASTSRLTLDGLETPRLQST